MQLTVKTSDVPKSFLLSQSHKPSESESSKIFSSRVRVESQELSSHWFVSSSHWFVGSSQCRIKQNFKFFSKTFLCYEMAPNNLENGAQCCFSKLYCRLFISKFFQLVFYLSLSPSVISTSLAILCCKRCNLSICVVLKVRST